MYIDAFRLENLNHFHVFEICSVQSHESQFSVGKEWKIILGEWLNLLKMMRSPKSFYLGQFLKNVLVYRC